MSPYQALDNLLNAGRVSPAIVQWVEVVRAEVDRLRTEVVVLNGSFCQEEQDDGAGPCGACVRCLRAELERLRGEREDAIQEEAIARGAEADRMNAAARMAAALKDLYNECGEINEVAAAYLSVAEDADHYQYLGESEEEMRQRLREQDARRRLAEERDAR